MPKVSKTRKSPSPDDEVKSIEEYYGLPADRDEEKPEQKAAEPTTADLLKRLDGLEKANAALQRTNLTLMQHPVTVSETRVQPKPVDMAGLPDPVTDPDGYTRGLNERINAAVTSTVEARMQPVQQQNTQNQKISALWDDFSEAYPDIAGTRTK